MKFITVFTKEYCLVLYINYSVLFVWIRGRTVSLILMSPICDPAKFVSQKSCLA